MVSFTNKKFLYIALPISLQSLVQASLGFIDQIMVGQLGSTTMAAVGIGAKIAFIVLILLQGVAGGVAIFIAQYIGNKSTQGIASTMASGWLISLLLTLPILLAATFFSQQIAELFTENSAAIHISQKYIFLSSFSFLPLVAILLLSAQLRCRGYAHIPLYTGVLSVVINTTLNYLLIFGKFGFPEMGAAGAAVSTVVARTVECLLIILFTVKVKGVIGFSYKISILSNGFLVKFCKVMLPILFSDLVWVAGDVTSVLIYSRHGIESLAAVMTSYPIQAIVFAILSGYTSASAISIGNQLGANLHQEANRSAHKFIALAVGIGLLLGLAIFIFINAYMSFFKFSEEVRQMGIYVNYILAACLWIKTVNIVAEESVLRAGGDTYYSFWINVLSMWLAGIPAALIAAFYLKLAVYWIFLFFLLEELVKAGLLWHRIQQKNWLKNLAA